MDVVKSSRFWIGLAVVIACTVMACLKVIPGETAVVVMASLLGGFGIGKAGVTNGVKVLLPLALTSLLAVSGCCTTSRCYLARGLTAIGAADKIAAPALDVACTAKIKACGQVPPESCPPFKLCTAAATSYQVAMDAAARALGACNKALADVGVK